MKEHKTDISKTSMEARKQAIAILQHLMSKNKLGAIYAKRCSHDAVFFSVRDTEDYIYSDMFLVKDQTTPYVFMWDISFNWLKAAKTQDLAYVVLDIFLDKAAEGYDICVARKHKCSLENEHIAVVKRGTCLEQLLVEMELDDA